MIDVWIKLGQLNPWICRAYDPNFGRDSFAECKTLDDLKIQLEQDNWSLGQAFYLDALCFINQVSAGGEWLTIKEGTPFESMTMKYIIRRGKFEGLIRRLREATVEACRALEY